MTAPFDLAGAGPSFADYLAATAPALLPGAGALGGQAWAQAPHGTTVVAVTHQDGVVVAGDRRATAGTVIASRDIDKVFVADDATAVAVTGAAGLGVELVRLFQVELEHYEKIEGAALSLDGKANRLAAMVRGNLAQAGLGLAVLPLLAGIDGQAPGVGRIFSYDITGGCFEERGHHCVGSGAAFARGAVKKLWRPGLSSAQALRVVVEALYDAADDDAATGGPDAARQIWPTCVQVDGDGARRLPDPDVEAVAQAVLADRRGNPGGAR